MFLDYTHTNRFRVVQENIELEVLRRFINQFMKVGGIKTWKELTTGVQQLVMLLFNNNFTNPGLVL